MNQVMGIAGASIREHWRRKLILVFVVITLAVTVVQITSSSEQGRPNTVAGILSGFISSTVFAQLAFVAALAVSMGNIGRPFSDGEAALILARPVARWQYALGRLTGSVGLVAGLCLLMAVEAQAVRLSHGQPMSLTTWSYWGVQAYNLTVISALTTLISAFTASPGLAAILALVVYSFAGAVDLVFRATGGFEDPLPIGILIAWLATPKMLRASTSGTGGEFRGSGSPIELFPGMANPASLVAWSLIYLALMVWITIITVKRKEVRG